MIPLETGTPEQFAELRQFLRAAGYTAGAICGRLDISEISAVISGEKPSFRPGPQDALDLLIRSLFLGAYVPESQAAGLFPATALNAMLQLGVLRRETAHPQLLYSPVMLYPAYGVYTASDRYTRPDGEPLDTGDDFVFPGISPHSGHFLAMLPESRCERFLDVGAGMGLAALGAASRYAAHAWSLDITQQATDYAQWNAALNGIPNLTVARGDMFAPVAGLTFDRIVMHPPYDLSAPNRPVYCNGGADGEIIVRRLFEEAGPHLAPGGRLYCLARIAELYDAPLEQRIRGWLGAFGEECDVAVISKDLTSPDEVALAGFVSSRASHDALAECKLRYQELGVEQLCYACIVVQRRAEERPTFTLRREKGPSWSSPGIEWLLAMQTALAADAAGVWQLPLRASRDLELLVRHEVRDQALTPADFTLRLTNPCKVELEVQRGIVEIVSNCTVQRTPAELYSAMTERSMFPQEAGENAFLEIVTGLMSAGILQPVAFPAPSGKPRAEALA